MTINEIISLLKDIYHNKQDWLTPPEVEALSLVINYLSNLPSSVRGARR